MAVAATGGGGRAEFWDVITWKGADCFRVYSENTNSEVYCIARVFTPMASEIGGC